MKRKPGKVRSVVPGRGRAAARVPREGAAPRGAKAKAPARLTHFDEAGAAHMVDVAAKGETHREAVARCVVDMAADTAAAIAAGAIGKGDVLGVARLAGIAASKRTADLIPLCHPVRLTSVDLALTASDRQVAIVATARAFDRTGVEMEALTAAAVAALTIYDMCKAIDRGMTIGPLALEAKSGGRSGAWPRGR